MVCRNQNQNNMQSQRIELGRVGEFGARTVTFDLSEFSAMGGGTYVLLHQRSNDFEPYTVNNYTVLGNRIVWNVDAFDTAYEGIGYAEVQLQREGELLAKSNPYMTHVSSSLEVSDAPEHITLMGGMRRFGNDIVVATNCNTNPRCKKGSEEEQRVELGRVGEYGARTVRFNLSAFHKFGDGDYVLVHQRALDFAPYVVANFSVDDEGKELVWSIDATDTACEGIGHAEIQLVNEGVLLAKSDSFLTFTDPSLGSAEPAKAYTQATIDIVAAYAASAHSYMELAEEYKEAAENYASYTAHPPMIGDDYNWYVWNGSVYVDSGVQARGVNGLDAYYYATQGGYAASEAQFYSDLGIIGTNRPVKVYFRDVSSENTHFIVANITAYHELMLEGFAYLSNPDAVDGQLTVTTSNGFVDFSGDFVGTTDIIATFTLNNAITGSGVVLDPYDLDDAPTANSDNLVKSGGTYTAIANEIITIDFGTLTGTGSTVTETVSNALITEDYKLIGWKFSNEQVYTTPLTITIQSGSIQVSGAINGTTTLEVYLGRSGATLS